MLLETLRADQLAARKNRNAAEASLLTTLIGEAAMVGKNALGGPDGTTPDPRDSTDSEVEATVRKFLKNVNETRRLLLDKCGAAEAVAATDIEIAILERYLPKQLGQDELTRAIEGILAAKPDAKIGEIMGALAKAHKGLYDGKSASAIANALINQAKG